MNDLYFLKDTSCTDGRANFDANIFKFNGYPALSIITQMDYTDINYVRKVIGFPPG